MKTIYFERVRDITEEPLLHKPDFIVHGCNCKHTMGAGLAKVMSHKFDAHMYELQHPVPGDISLFPVSDRTMGVNAYTQSSPGPHASYLAIIKCLQAINKISKDKCVAFPAIGCGIGDLDWPVVEELIRRYLTAPARVEFVFLTEIEKEHHYEI